jgi:hypothetical protein
VIQDPSRTFIATPGIDYIRRVFDRRGWAEAANNKTSFFGFKWVHEDHDYDYLILRNGQYFNHIPKNGEIST